MNSFDIIWQSVNDHYFDPNFGGVDWNEAYNRYGSLVSDIEDGPEFYSLANKMLFELNASNTIIVPRDDMTFFSPTVLAEGSSGMDVRLIQDNVVITRTEPGSTAEKAGLQPGFLIHSIDGINSQEIIKEEEKKLTPPFNDRSRRFTITNAIWSHLYGIPETALTIGFLDGDCLYHEVEILRKARGYDSIGQLGDFSAFLSFESKHLSDGVGYIRLNCFHPDMADNIIFAIDSMKDTAGIVIDLRGNSCGLLKVRKLVAEKLVSEPALFWQFKTRHECYDIFLDPLENSYEGRVVILIDSMSGESSEEFAGCMQAIGRATIVGEHSRGAVLATEMIRLPKGATFVFAVAQILTANDTILEGYGVVPDIEVPLDRYSLLKGKDPQLETALDYLKMNNPICFPINHHATPYLN